MPSLLIDIEGRLSKFADALEQANKQITGFKRRTDRTLEGIGKITLGIVGADTVMRALDFLKSSFADGISKAKEMEADMLRLGAVLKSTGMSAGFTGTQIEEMVQSLAKKTVYDDDEIRKAATALLRFRDIQGETFRETLNYAPDVASALGTDLTNAAQILGKAAQGSGNDLRALKDAGIKLSQANIDLAARLTEVGDRAGAAKILFDALKLSIGGTAEGESQGAYGATRRLENAWDNLKKGFGEQFLQSNTENFNLLAEGIKRTTGEIKTMDLSIQQMGINLVKSFFNPLRIGLPSVLGEMKKGVQQVSGKIKGQSGKPLEEEQAAKAQAEQAADIEKNRLKILNKELAGGRAELQDKYAAQHLEKTKFNLDLEQSINENAYKQGLESLSTYYDKQESIVRATLRAQQKEIGKRASDAQSVLQPESKESERLAVANKLQDLKGKGLEAEYDAKRKLQTINEERQIAEQAEVDAVLKVTAALYEQNGQLEAAAKLQQDITNRKLKTRATAGDESAKTQLEKQGKLDDRTNVEKRLLELRNKDEVALQHLQNEEASLTALREAGGITEIEMLQRIDAARAQTVIGMKERAVAMQAEAKASGDVTGKLQADAEAAQVAAEVLQTSIGGVEKQFRDIGQGAMQQFFEDFSSGTKSMKSLFNDAVGAIVAGISRIAAQNVSEQLFGKQSATSTLLSNLIGSFIGGGAASSGYMSGASTPPEMHAKGAAFNVGGHKIAQFGLGDVVTAPRFFRAAMGLGVMGEAGPEGILPLRRGRDGRLGVQAQGASSSPVIQNLYITTPDLRSFTESQGQMAKKAARALAGARRNL